MIRKKLKEAAETFLHRIQICDLSARICKHEFFHGILSYHYHRTCDVPISIWSCHCSRVCARSGSFNIQGHRQLDNNGVDIIRVNIIAATLINLLLLFLKKVYKILNFRMRPLLIIAHHPMLEVEGVLYSFLDMVHISHSHCILRGLGLGEEQEASWVK